MNKNFDHKQLEDLFVPYNKKDMKTGKYLMRTENEICIQYFAEDLYKIDDYYFSDKINCSGFYEEDDYMYFEIDDNDFISYLPLNNLFC